MAIKVTDKIVYESRCETADILAGLRRVLGSVPEGVPEFLAELEASCFEASLDFPILASHAANECNIWRDRNWLDKWNAFGIGITGPGVVGVIFPSPAACARFAVAEYLLKLRRPLGSFADARQFAPAKFDRVKALVNGGNWPKVERISDLNKPFGDGDFVWMEDRNGPSAIVAKGNALVNVPDQQSGGTDPMPSKIDVTFERSLIGRTKAALTKRDAFVTIHCTGNNVSRFAERDFFKGGGGAQGVLVHFIVDAGGILQITPLWSRGVHAGNDDGNQTSIAIENRQSGDDPAMVEQNLAKLLAMLYRRDPRIDWSGAEAFTFTDDRTVMHASWSGANPGCPALFISRHGKDGVLPFFRAEAAKFGGTVTPVPKPMPHTVGGEADSTGKTFKDDNGNQWLWIKKRFFMDVPLQAYEFANTASRKGPLYKPGKRITVYYVVAGEGADGMPDLWGTTRQGWRVQMAEVI